LDKIVFHKNIPLIEHAQEKNCNATLSQFDNDMNKYSHQWQFEDDYLTKPTTAYSKSILTSSMNSLEAKLAELTVSPCINAIGEKKN
jgi:hypothetical protein